MSSSPGHYQATDPIINSSFTPFSSVSRVRQGDGSVARRSETHASETAPLLGHGAAKPAKKPFYRPRPLWLVPFAIVASIVRGMTLAPRVQVYTQLSCNAVYGHDVYDHTSDNHTLVSSSLSSASAHFYSALDPAGPALLQASTLPLFESGSYVTFSSDEDEDEEPDPRRTPSKRCLSDPKVTAGAAKIQTLMVITMGGLSALTTGWWGHYGEQHGRTRVLAASTLGLFLTDLTFILVSTPHSPFAAHGHKLLIISPIIEGLLGGWSTLQGATSAYVSDCTSDGSRAQIFSRFTGVFYLGFSLGPTIGAYLIRHPFFSFPGYPTSSGSPPGVHNGQPTVTSVFYVAAMCSFINLLMVLFVFPESINKKKAKAPGKPSPVVIAPVAEETLTGVAQPGWLLRVFSPLTLFAPKKIQTPEGGYRKDWSLSILGIAMFVFLLATGIFQIKYLYAGHVYEWGAEQLSYYITLMGGVRAIHLLFVMPYLINKFKPKPKQKVPVPIPSTSGAVAPVHKAQPVSGSKKPKPTLGHLAKEMNFDLILLRLSFFIEFLSHASVSLLPASMGAGYFVAATTLSSFGAGVIPAVNSLALCIMQMQAQAGGDGATTDDNASAGRLFGALAALQSVGQMILGPLIFGIVYTETVATFPKTIFVTAASITLVGLALLCLLRPDVALRAKLQRRARRADEAERGRSRISKDIGKAAFPVASSSGYSSGSSP